MKGSISILLTTVSPVLTQNPAHFFCMKTYKIYLLNEEKSTHTHTLTLTLIDVLTSYNHSFSTELSQRPQAGFHNTLISRTNYAPVETLFPSFLTYQKFQP